MPMIKALMSGMRDAGLKRELALKLSKACAEATGKPESYVLSLVHDGADAVFGGKAEDSAFVDVRGIGGLGPDVCKRLSASVCAILKEKAGLRPDRVYINFTELSAANWGWNSTTFAG